MLRQEDWLRNSASYTYEIYKALSERFEELYKEHQSISKDMTDLLLAVAMMDINDDLQEACNALDIAKKITEAAGYDWDEILVAARIKTKSPL